MNSERMPRLAYIFASSLLMSPNVLEAKRLSPLPSGIIGCITGEINPDGSGFYAVPDLIGMQFNSERMRKTMAMTPNMRVKVMSYSPSEKYGTGTIISQNPKECTKLDRQKNYEIEIIVSSGGTKESP